jgi:hypothetical protein
VSDLKEYIVTLKNYDDIFDFYEDIESPGGNLYIPDRSVECCQRRMNSRNTHYLLTDEEADTVRNDPRVLAVERKPEDIGIVPIRFVEEDIDPLFTQSSDTWNKSSSNTSTHKNWALLRCVEGLQRANWGSDGPVNQRSQSGTIQARAEGRNVDVVIVDGMINPAHPEYSVNADGTGGTRVVQYNWFQHNLGQASNNYVYTPYVDASDANRTADNNHGAHCAGTVAGNTQGWARSANIYNINPYSTDVNGTSATLLIDYIRAFHNGKSINPVTGRRNPTICNHSWGYGSALAIANISGITFRGATVSGPFTEAQVRSYGIWTRNIDGTIYAIRPARVAAVDADMVDAFNDGIIMVGAAGNDYTKIDVVGGADYNNSFTWSGFFVPYHRGSTPGAADGCICVGAVSALVAESKSDFSNTGPRVDIQAPGQNIMSSFNSTGSFGGTTDPRNSSFFIGKISGTSMASPQVCGVLATALEVYPNMTPAEAREYIRHYAKLGQMTDTGGDVTDYTSLQGADNRYLFYYKERADSGQLSPKNDVRIRGQTDRVFPRVRIRR